MNKRLIIASLLFILATGFSVYALTQHQKHNLPVAEIEQPGSFVLYYGNTCPHCKIVEEYITTNQIADKLPIINKEVYDNFGNAGELAERAKFCRITTDLIPVPFLWTGQECLIGDQPIINFLNSQITNK